MVATRSGRRTEEPIEPVALPTRTRRKTVAKDVPKPVLEEEASLRQWVVEAPGSNVASAAATPKPDAAVHIEDQAEDREEDFALPFQTITPLKVISPRSTSKASSDGPKSAAKTPANAVKTPSTRTPNSASPAVPLSTRSRRVVEELSSIPLPEDTPSDSSARQTPQSSKGSRGSTSTTPTTSQRSKKSAKKGPQQEQRQGAGFLRKAFLLLLFLALPLVAAAFLCSGSPLLPHALVASVNPTCTQVQQVLVDARAAAFARAEQAGLKPDELLHQLSARIAPITEAAEQALGTAQAAALDAYARLAQLAAQAGISLPGAGPSGHSFEAVLSIDRMTPIISLEPRWVDSLQDMYAHASGSSSSRSVAARKAAGLALSCRHDAECAAAQAALTAAVTSAAALLHVRGREFAGSDAAGALQQALAAFFSATPNGVVLVTDLDFVTLGAVTVLNNALSEAGSLQAGGKAVPTSRGLFVLLVHVPHAVESAEDYEFTVKEKLQLCVHSKAADYADTTASALARAFRRRVDLVLPASPVDPPATPPAPPAPAPSPAPAEEQQQQHAEEVDVASV